MEKYIVYTIYECPRTPTEHGKYIGKTPILEQAINVLERAKECGKSYFLKGIKVDGTEVIFL